MDFSLVYRSQPKEILLSLILLAQLFNSTNALADINTSRVSGLAWLYQDQNGDGSWGHSGHQMQATYIAMTDLRDAGVVNATGKSGGNSFNAAASWVSNANPSSVDSAATQILAMYLSTSNPAKEFYALKNARNYRKFTWGSLPGYSANVADTALAALALISPPTTSTSSTYLTTDQSALSSEACYVFTAQDNTSSGWPYLSKNGVSGTPSSNASSSVLPTAYAIQFLQGLISTGAINLLSSNCSTAINVTNASNAINNGISYLLTKQNATDHGFGEDVVGGVGKSTAFDSGLVYNTIFQINPNHPALAQIQSYLISTQLSNGSWNNDALQTAYALRAMPRTALAISNNDGIPDAVKLAMGLPNTSVAARNLKPGNGQGVVGSTSALDLPANGIVTTAYGYSLPGTGNGAFQLVGGYLPDGLMLRQNGRITGTPTSTGKFTFSYTINNGPVKTASITLNSLTGPIGVFASPRNDFDGDGMSDLLWYQASSGTTSIAYINGTTVKSLLSIGGTADWGAIGSGDFDGDGKVDLLWRQVSTGAMGIFFMNRPIISANWVGFGGDKDWSVIGTGDFDGDGKSDMLWRQASSGNVGIIFMNGSVGSSWVGIGGDKDWGVAGVGDFDGDGKSDVIWRKASTGDTGIIFMKGSTGSTWVSIGGGLDWRVVTTGDFNGDGKSDIVWNQISIGLVGVSLMNGSNVLQWIGIGGDKDWGAIEAGDFNGDAKSDIVWRQASTGNLGVLYMTDGVVNSWQGFGGDKNWNVIPITQ